MALARLACIAVLSFLLAAPHAVQARPALVIDANSGEVLHAHEATALWYPASVTKVMTAYVALSAQRHGRISMTSQLRVSERAIAAPPSKTGMPVGSSLTLEDALRILMVKSANDTAITVAEGVSGSVEAFVAEMNKTAARLGMRDTHYNNPNGLPDRGQITTARDQAILARALYRDFRRYAYLFKLESVKIGKRTFKNHNSLIGKYPGADGLKTGFICDSGFNLVASAHRNNRHLIGVVFGSKNPKEREAAMVALLDNGFNKRRGLFQSRRRRTKVDSLPRTRRNAIVMREFVCGPRKKRADVPAQIASYGIAGKIIAAPNTVESGGKAQASALVYTAAGTSGNQRANSTSVATGQPVRILNVPMPTRNPRR